MYMHVSISRACHIVNKPTCVLARLNTRFLQRMQHCDRYRRDLCVSHTHNKTGHDNTISIIECH